MKRGHFLALLWLGSSACSHTASTPSVLPAEASAPGPSTADSGATASGTGASVATTAEAGAGTTDALPTTSQTGNIDAMVPPDTGTIATSAMDGAADAGPPEVGGDNGNGSGSAPLRDETVTIMDQGRARTVIVHAPAHGPGLLSLVFNLHGSGGTAAGQRVYSNMDQSADAHGFIAAYPEGAIAVGTGFAWNVTGQVLTTGAPPPPGSADDNAFFSRAISLLSQRYPVDPKRIYASGFSGGARMTSQIGCELSTLVAAVAPFAGLRFPTPCSAMRAVPVVSFHGTADTTNPYDGNGPAYWTYSVPSAAQQWGAHDSCGATPTVSAVAASVELRSYTGCAGGAAVSLYTIAGMGHEMPGVPGGNAAIAGIEVMWTFFAAHPLP